MTTNAARNATVVADHGIEGVIRVYLEGVNDVDGRKAARTAAQKAHGGIGIGATPKPQKAKRGVIFDFTPVAIVKASAKAGAPAKGEDRLAYLERMVLELSQELAGMRGDAVVTVPAKALTAGKAKAATPRESFVSKAKAAHAAAACKRCADHGVVPGSAAKMAESAYFRTANGAATAPTAIPCPAKGCKARKARKAA